MEATTLHQTKFFPNRVQKGFIESRASADLFSSRMGEGKSTGLAWACYYHTRHNPGATWVLIRDTWENLRRTTLTSFLEWFPSGIYGNFNKTEKKYTWSEGVAKGEVYFLGMDNDEDAGKLMSMSIAGIGMDEVAPGIGNAGISESIFDFAMTRLRQKGMNWYACKLAENNPDETHWTYKRFITDTREDFVIWQPSHPENTQNLPSDYYAKLRRTLSHRPDLIRRFVDGDFGFQQVGRAVTPQWSDKLHLATGLVPVSGVPLILCWDFGLNPSCIITQKTPLGSWNALYALVGDGIGVEELINDATAPLLKQEYPRYALQHIGDPAGTSREQSSSARSAVKSLKQKLGGTWRSGPIAIHERIDPLQAVLSRAIYGKGVVQVDRTNAASLWHALRGGWHYHVSRQGIVSGTPVKDINSHPGDAFAYGAAILFPMGRKIIKKGQQPPSSANIGGRYFQGDSILGRPGVIMPAHGSVMKGT